MAFINQERKMVKRKQNKIVRCYRLIILIGASLAILMILASCGQNAPDTSSSSTGSTVTPLRLSPTPSTTLPPAGEVTLHVASVTPYTITIILANKSNQTILFSDHLTECTVILLQLIPQGMSSKQWQAVAPCKKEILTRLHTLAPGKDLTVVLTAPGGQWVPGLYRTLLTYSLSGASATPRTVFSSSFQMGSFNLCQRTEIACQASPGP
jgi:hypothetical protein